MNSPCDVAAELVLKHLYMRHGAHWLSGPRDRGTRAAGSPALLEHLHELGIEVPERRRAHLAGLTNYQELWQAYFFRGVVLDSHEGQLGWMEGRYALDARYDIPTPIEMLAAQCAGRRYVTLLIQPEQQFLRYGRHADACAFLLHDFEHAHKFFADSDSYRGQVRFFRGLRMALPALARWHGDMRFQQDVEYLMADMNSHPVHLIKFFKAVVLAAEIRRTGESHPDLDRFWLDLLSAWGMCEDAATASLRLNQPGLESQLEQRAVAEFFIRPESTCASALSAGK